jgi:hypothetical protein
MAVFDPNDSWDGGWSWFRTPNSERRGAEEINREVVTRWFASLALCLCFAVLAPVAHLAWSFATLLVMAAIASAGLALIAGNDFHSPHLTAWDAALWSLAAGLAVWLCSVPHGLGSS